MSKNDQRKNEALRLHKNGIVPSKIATKLGVSARTIQRWLKDETPIPVKVVAMKADEDIPPPARKDVADCDKFDMTLSRRMAIRLLNLSEAALGAVEDTLNDPDARRADKLRAAKLVGDWLGMGTASKHPSGDLVAAPRRVEQVFGVSLVNSPPPKPSQPIPALSGDAGEEE